MTLPPAPPPSSATATMRANRATNTGPEVALRRELHARGCRYRLGVRLVLPARAVRPDVTFRKQRVAVFVDGCFWHSCPTHGRKPSDPTGYWAAKLGRNRDRDDAVNRALDEAGWSVIRIWEHEPVAEAADRVIAALQTSASGGHQRVATLETRESRR